MKKLLSICIVGILFFTAIGAARLPHNNPISNANDAEKLDYTHTVFVEVGTATWCPGCPSSNTAWHTIYGSGNYDFEYTELVYDMNTVASSRFYEFNPRYVPTSYWDGGQFAYPGMNTGTFYSYLDSSGIRVVPDLDADLSVSWLGNTQIQMTYNVVNNDASSYPGRLRIYILELVSSY